MLTRRSVVVLASATVFAVTLAGLNDPVSAAAKVAPVFTSIIKGVAVGGYDPVAYFTSGKPIHGSKGITLAHKGATWRFASEANRDAFKADPAKYAPQFGGYCAWAVSQGYTAKGDPEAWKIVSGKLYLNYNRSVRRSWAKNAAKLIRKGNANWPKLHKN